jgi:competence protein ComEC
MSFYEFLRTAPYVRLLLPFLVGIIAGSYFHFSMTTRWTLYGLAFLLMVFCAFINHRNQYRFRWVWGMFFNISMVFCGIVLISAPDKPVAMSDSNIIAIGTILENPVVKETTSSVMVSLTAIQENEKWQSRSDKILCSLQKNKFSDSLKIDQRIVFRTYLNEIKNYGNPHEFDYKGYMNRNGVYYRAYADSTDWYVLGESHDFKLTLWALKLRNRMMDYFRQLNLSPSAFAVISALTMGDKSYLDAELKSAYVNSGTVHLLAVSGMHVALLFWLLQQITRPIMLWRRGKFIRTAFVLVVIWIYALVTGLTPSVVRASVMFSFWMLGDTGNRSVNIYNTLSASALLLLIINPQTLFEVGFQLSYMAVLGIVVFYKDIHNLFLFRNPAAKYIWSLISVSLSAQLFTLPLTLYYFQQFPNYFLLSNIIALPLATIILYGSIFALILAPLKFLWVPVGWVLKILVGLLNQALLWIEQLPGSVTTGISISGIIAVSIFVLIVAVRIFLFNRKAYALMAVIFCCIIVAADILMKHFRVLRTGETVVYNTPGPLLIQVRQGYDNRLFTNTFEYNTARAVKSYSEFHYLKPVDPVVLDSTTVYNDTGAKFYRGFLIVGGKKFYIWNKPPDFKKQISVDVLVISKMSSREPTLIGKYFQPGEVVVTSGVNRFTATKINEYCRNREISCTLVSTDGAWIQAN